MTTPEAVTWVTRPRAKDGGQAYASSLQLVHVGAHLKFASKLQGLASKLQRVWAPGQGRGIKQADSPCWHLGRAISAECL